MYKKVMTGPKPEGLTGVADLSTREKLVAAPLIAFFIVLGFYPKPALDVINPAVDTSLSYVQTDAASQGTAAEGSTK